MNSRALISVVLVIAGSGVGQALELTCPESITVACRQLEQTAITGRPEAKTDCGTPTLEYRDSLVAGDSTLWRTWTAADTCGGRESCTQVIRYSAARPRIAILPLENLVAAEEGVRVLVRLLEQSVSRTGSLELIPAGQVEDALLRGRVRQPYLMDDEQRMKLTVALDAEYFVVGSLLNYSTYTDQYSGPIPLISCTLQLQRAGDGQTIWSASTHAAGNEGEWLFGMGVEHDITRLAAGIAKQSVEKFTESVRMQPCPALGR